MTLITDAATIWSNPVTLTAAEVWQNRAGSVFITTTDTPDLTDGLWLHEMHALHLSAGVTVRYRKEGNGTALIAREAV
ncbi:hypothetical protein Q4555_15530 [Octadecabacter sp. 1_MG-2023]|uniref:hypothetical protein n=1 Tax=unclassified Octadecabacter TaxID=196158 RepID=UPI001C0910E9|nr:MULTISPECIES: hypothetical protein [unclassified Octadecabacter]MBU2994057.1 hypothetical protein [Octadecabacter sp. B2R22]MDO6736089.1 hypothetical protein [Octadecabacter sp. 1_MG-2023]